jgi:hypothetical protein
MGPQPVTMLWLSSNDKVQHSDVDGSLALAWAWHWLTCVQLKEAATADHLLGRQQAMTSQVDWLMQGHSLKGHTASGETCQCQAA